MRIYTTTVLCIDTSIHQICLLRPSLGGHGFLSFSLSFFPPFFLSFFPSSPLFFSFFPLFVFPCRFLLDGPIKGDERAIRAKGGQVPPCPHIERERFLTLLVQTNDPTPCALQSFFFSFFLSSFIPTIRMDVSVGLRSKPPSN